MVHVEAGANVLPQVEEAVVPDGQVGYEIDRFVAGIDPVFEMTSCLALPVNAALKAVSLTESASAETLGVRVAVANETCTV